MSILPALFCNIRHLSGNIQCQVQGHEVWRPNGQESSDARKTSKYQVFWRKKHLIMIKHASKCFQVVSRSSLLPCLGNELHLPDEGVVFPLEASKRILSSPTDLMGQQSCPFQNPMCPCWDEMVKPCLPGALPWIGYPMSLWQVPGRPSVDSPQLESTSFSGPAWVKLTFKVWDKN